MKSATSILSVVLCLAWLLPSPGYADVFEEVLRNAALKNGLRPAAQLYDDTDADLAEVGKMFFESEHIGLNNRISCRTCHLDEFGSSDGLPLAVGIFGAGKGPQRAESDGRVLPRNALPLWGRGAPGFETFFWDGRVDFSRGRRLSQFGDQTPSSDPLVVAAHLPPLELREMLDEDGMVLPFTRESVDHAKALLSHLVERLNEAESAAMSSLAAKLNLPAGSLTFREIARSLAAFIRSDFRLRETKFQRFVFGSEALRDDELKGGMIFYGKGKCAVCHTGPYFTDFDFHAVPFPQLGFGRNGFGIDYGRFNVTFDPADLYRFRTPPLWNVERTGPYGHSGSIATLREAIIAHFDPLRSVDPSKLSAVSRHDLFQRMAAASDDSPLLGFLTEEEVDHVLAFLRTLSF